MRYEFARRGAPVVRAAATLAAALVVIAAGPATAQLRVVTYNTAEGALPELLTVFRAIGEETRNGFSKPIDVLALQEQTTPATTTQDIVNLLNSFYGADTYRRGALIGTSTGAGRPSIVYNKNTVQLIAESAASTTSVTGGARATLRHQLRPVGYDSSADFYLYNSHYKAADTADDADRRNIEATQVRANADALGEGANLIYAGDFNVYRSTEPMYQTLRAAGPGQAVDPLNVSNVTQNWSNNGSFASLHTQSPCSSASGNCGVGGGVDDRFDFQLLSAEVFDSEGFAFIPGSYRPFGNNGSTFNQSINSGSNTITFPGVTSFTKAQVLSALFTSTDHLPVVADYQVPAVMSVAIDSVPARRVRGVPGSTAAVGVAVTNSAGVVAAIGADNLDFGVTTGGAATGGFGGSALALGTAISGSVVIPVGAAGSFSGSVTADATSNATQNGLQTSNLAYTVVDPANPSFVSGIDTNTLTIDFGSVGIGVPSLSHVFNLFNLTATAGFASALDLDSIMGSGATAALSTSVPTFSGLAAGSGLTFEAGLGTANEGSFAASYTLNFSDEDILGATTHSMTLNLLGSVTRGASGDYNGDGFVEAADYTAWRDTLGLPVAAGTGADGDRDGVIDAGDYDVWVANYGFAAPSTSTAVPEPVSATVALVAVILVGRRRA
ncbi:MAG: hypothetical protein ACRCT8_07370 [Lacipirellulaceae bacterium]